MVYLQILFVNMLVGHILRVVGICLKLPEFFLVSRATVQIEDLDQPVVVVDIPADGR